MHNPMDSCYDIEVLHIDFEDPHSLEELDTSRLKLNMIKRKVQPHATTHGLGMPKKHITWHLKRQRTFRRFWRALSFRKRNSQKVSSSWWRKVSGLRTTEIPAVFGLSVPAVQTAVRPICACMPR